MSGLEVKRTRRFAATLLAVSSLPSGAQISLDMNAITRRDWLGYSPENQNFVRFWLSGYYNAAVNNSVPNYNRLQRNSAKVAAYCKGHRSATLPTAIQNAAK
jgi:hypothetical protein